MARPRKYRLWTDEEKRSICQQTRGPGVSVARVARRYAMNANLIFKWLRDPRFNPPAVEDCTASFLPVEVVAAPAPPVINPPIIEPPIIEPPLLDPPVIEPKVSETKIEISLSNGHHIRVSGAYDPDALCRLVRGLR